MWRADRITSVRDREPDLTLSGTGKKVEPHNGALNSYYIVNPSAETKSTIRYNTATLCHCPSTSFHLIMSDTN